MKSMLRKIYGDEIIALAKNDENIIVLDGDLSTSTKTDGFASAFPERFINCGIAEQNMVSVASGLASAGNTVFVSSFAMFLAGRAYDQIRNGVAYTNQNVKLIATHAGLSVGEDGATHQSLEDISLMRVVPNMTLIVPSDAEQTRAAVRYAASVFGPCYIRLGRVETDDHYKSGEIDFLSRKSFVLRQGSDVLLLFSGPFCKTALKAADILEKRGISACVVDVPFVKPLPDSVFESLLPSHRLVVTLEEHSVIGGFGGAVCERASEIGGFPQVLRLGVLDAFGKSGKPDELLRLYGLDAQSVADSIFNRIK